MDSLAEQTPDIDDAAKAKLFAGGTLKDSILSCRGNAEFEGGNMIAYSCPSPTKCQEQVFYRNLPEVPYKEMAKAAQKNQPIKSERVFTPKTVQ